MEAIRYSSAESLLQEQNCLISLPEVCMKLREALADPDHKRIDISNIISCDPSLTSRILRIVNSAYFGLVSPVNDIPHALGILGEYGLNNLVIVTSVIKAMSTQGSELDVQTFWKKSIFCAVMSRNLASHCQVNIKEEMFISGLLLNVGQLVLYYHEVDLLKAVKEEAINSSREEYIIENEFLGFDHSDVGAAMAKSWNFSPLLIDTILSHHDLSKGSSGSKANLMTNLVSTCCEELDFSEGAAQTPDDFQPELAPDLNINEEDFLAILDTSCHEYAQTYETFCGGVA